MKSLLQTSWSVLRRTADAIATGRSADVWLRMIGAAGW
jgi:hypothetical protein